MENSERKSVNLENDKTDEINVFKTQCPPSVMSEEQSISPRNQIEKPFKCEKCEFSSHRSYLLRRHIKYWHDNQTYVCDICGYTAMNHIRMYQHKTWTHSNKTYKCEYCHYVAKIKPWLNRHKMRMHKSEYEKEKIERIELLRRKKAARDFSCTICNYVSKTSYTLQMHKDSHATEPKYFCETCDFSTNTKCKLMSHRYTHSNIIHKCNFCDYESNHRIRFLNHQAKHRPKKLVRHRASTNNKGAQDLTNFESHEMDAPSTIDYEKSQVTRALVGNRSLTLKKMNTCHRSPLGRIFECAHCKFFTPWGIKIKHHLFTHVTDKLKFAMELFDSQKNECCDE